MSNRWFLLACTLCAASTYGVSSAWRFAKDTITEARNEASAEKALRAEEAGRLSVSDKYPDRTDVLLARERSLYPDRRYVLQSVEHGGMRRIFLVDSNTGRTWEYVIIVDEKGGETGEKRLNEIEVENLTEARWSGDIFGDIRREKEAAKASMDEISKRRRVALESQYGSTARQQLSEWRRSHVKATYADEQLEYERILNALGSNGHATPEHINEKLGFPGLNTERPPP